MRRLELSDYEWRVIQPLLPNKPHGVARADDRRVLNGNLWRFRTGSPWRGIPERYGVLARPPEAGAALGRALARGGHDRVTSLHRTDTVDEARCWLRGPGWCLVYE